MLGKFSLSPQRGLIQLHFDSVGDQLGPTAYASHATVLMAEVNRGKGTKNQFSYYAPL